MRVLIGGFFGNIVGGAEKYIHEIGCEFVKLGFEHKVIIFSSIKMDLSNHYFNANNMNSSNILNYCLDWKPDVLFANGMGNPLLEQALFSNIPTIQFAHAYAGCCISGTKTFSSSYIKICKKSLSIQCLFRYFPFRCGGLNPLTALRAFNRERIRLKAFKRTRTICVASQHMRSVMIQNGIPEDKVRLLPLFPTHGEPDPAPPAPRPRTDKVLLAGRLTRLKGWTHLVPAIAMASKQLGRRLVLMVAGDGPDRGRLTLLARKWDVPLEDHGWQASAGVTRLMREADLLAVPSLWPEPFGLVGIEAGCVGTPAVAYAVGGIPDWLVAGVSGELAPAESLRPRPLADAIVRALQDAGHWQRLREGAWRQAGEFSRQRHIEQLVGILRGAMG